MKGKTTTALKASLTLIVIAVCFSFNSSSLNTDTTNSLDAIISQLDSLSSFTLTLTGHTDDVGTNEYNIRLSESRAMAVRNYLISKNVDSTKINIGFQGEKAPMFPNTSEENRAMNRRVEITLNGEKKEPVSEEIVISDSLKAEPAQQFPDKVSKHEEVKNIPVKAEVKRKKVRRRLVWTGWRTGFHWNTSGR